MEISKTGYTFLSQISIGKIDEKAIPKDVLRLIWEELDDVSLNNFVLACTDKRFVKQTKVVFVTALPILGKREINRLCLYSELSKVINGKPTIKLLKALRKYHKVLGTAELKKKDILSYKEFYPDILKQLPEQVLDAFITWQTASQAFINAARDGDLEKVTAELKKDNVWVNGCDNQGLTAFHLAAQGGYQDVVKLLLAQEGVYKNAQDYNGGTALHLALRSGHLGMVKLLLAQGCIDINAQDYFGDTARSLALQEGEYQVASVLFWKEWKSTFGMVAAVAVTSFASWRLFKWIK